MFEDYSSVSGSYIDILSKNWLMKIVFTKNVVPSFIINKHKMSNKIEINDINVSEQMVDKKWLLNFDQW